MQSGVVIVDQNVITEKVDQVTTKGGSSYTTGRITGSYVDNGETWGWPTNSPYIITSGYEYRWGTFHEGIDISGTGYGSPIYASLDGIVAFVGWNGKCGIGAGYCVLLSHSNGYYTLYAHMVNDSSSVSAGQSVTRGQIIGSMGTTGYVTGYHLHFGVWYGEPYASSSHLVNPLSLWG